MRSHKKILFVMIGSFLFLLPGCAAMQAKNNASLGAYYFGQNDFKKAVEHMEKAVQEDPENVGHQTFLGWSYFKAGDCNRAIQAFQKVERLDPKALDAYTGRGWCNFKLGNFDEAIGWFTKATEVDASASDPYAGLGWATLRKGDTAGAEKHFQDALRKALKFQPGAWLPETRGHPMAWTRTDPEAHRGLGHLYFGQGDYKAAAKHFRIAINLMPDWNDARVKLADSLYALEDYPGAMWAYESALRREKTVEIYDKLGWCYTKVGDSSAFFGLIDFFDMQDKAREMFKKALALDPTYPSSLSGLSKLGPESTEPQ